MTFTRFVSAWLLVAFLCPPHAVAAQAVQDEAAKWQAIIERLEPAAMVSIRLKDGSHFKGTVLSAQAETFTVKPRTRIPVPGRDLRYDAVASLERTTVGMSPAKKVLIGVGAGAGALLVLMAAVLASAYD